MTVEALERVTRVVEPSLGEVVSRSVERFYSVSFTYDNGVIKAYGPATAVHDTLAQIDLAPSALFLSLSKQTDLNVRDLNNKLVGLCATAEEVLMSISIGIVDEELHRKHPELADEYIRREQEILLLGQ